MPGKLPGIFASAGVFPEGPRIGRNDGRKFVAKATNYAHFVAKATNISAAYFRLRIAGVFGRRAAQARRRLLCAPDFDGLIVSCLWEGAAMA